jgi:hypothetical protein
MRPLRTDSSFLALARTAGSAALARACDTGTFTAVRACTFPWGNHGWSFTVSNDRGSTWAIRVEVLEKERRYRTRVVKL